MVELELMRCICHRAKLKRLFLCLGLELAVGTDIFLRLLDCCFFRFLDVLAHVLNLQLFLLHSLV